MESDIINYVQYWIYMKKLQSTSIKCTILSVENYCAVVTEKQFPIFNLMLYVLCIIFPSLNQQLMHHLSYTKSRSLTNSPMRFDARWRHLQGVPCQLLPFQHVRLFPMTVRPCVAEMRSTLMIQNFYSFMMVASTVLKIMLTLVTSNTWF